MPSRSLNAMNPDTADLLSADGVRGARVPEAEEMSEETETAYRAALDSAVRSLGQREHSGRELERKLKSKDHDPMLIERVMAYLAEHDLQSDTRFAEGLVRSRVQRGYGPMKIRQELAAKGVSERILEDQLTEPSEFWMSIAVGSLDKKFGYAPDSREAWAVQARFLARRGFPSDLIYRVLGSQKE
ncbi:MAG: regulatory protein RecX [Gammaproteobacteria bacterium]|nr:MAG: regulatory protein RecX [Gammaproteobacteria bacterium]